MSTIDPGAISPEDIDSNEVGTDPASAMLAREGMRAPPRLRRAVREDLRSGRDWARARCGSTARHIREEPMKAIAYAVGAGLLLGLLLRR